MKVLSTDGLTKLIKLVKSTFATKKSLSTVATSGSYKDLSNKPTIPTTTSSVTSGSTAALTSGGAYTNLVRRKSTSAATGSSTQGIYVDANGQIQTCTAVTSTYASTGTAPVNGKAVSNAIATKQDTLVSGTNIKTINNESILGSGNIVIETIAVKNVLDNSTLPIWHGTETQWNHLERIWYNWQTNATATWSNGGNTPVTISSRMPTAFGNNMYVLTNGQGRIIVSNNSGSSWSQYNIGISTPLAGIVYTNEKFIMAGTSNSVLVTIHFNNDLTFSQYNSSISGLNFQGLAYNETDNVLVVISSNGKTAYSLDYGQNWSLGGEIPTSSAFNSTKCIVYGNGRFIAVDGSGQTFYSTDNGITWDTGGNLSLPSNANCFIVYGDGVFAILPYINTNIIKFSNDGGITWTDTTVSNSNYYRDICYGNGCFVIIYSDYYFYTFDKGANWVKYSHTKDNYNFVNSVYGNGKFITVGYKSTTTATRIISITYSKCYTDTVNPTTSSKVYSEPTTQSALTISSVTSGAITLSNNNTYYYNQSCNAYTSQTVGDAHPEYLCFIDGIGVKMGNTFIATNNFNS